MTTNEQRPSMVPHPQCPFCFGSDLDYNDKPFHQYDEGELFSCRGCGGHGRSEELEEFDPDDVEDIDEDGGEERLALALQAFIDRDPYTDAAGRRI